MNFNDLNNNLFIEVLRLSSQILSECEKTEQKAKINQSETENNDYFSNRHYFNLVKTAWTTTIILFLCLQSEAISKLRTNN